jgi:Ca2+-binding RTX toxin-like protein
MTLARRTATAALIALAPATVWFVAATPHVAGQTQPECLGLPATIVGDPDGDGVITGDETDNVIVGTEKADKIVGGGGDDRICGLGADDSLEGGEGFDRVNGGPGEDLCDGERAVNCEKGGATPPAADPAPPSPEPAPAA